MTDGTNAKEFKTNRAYQTGDVSFHGQVTIECNTKATDRTRHGNRCTALPIIIESGKEEEKDLDLICTRGYSHYFGLVTGQFKSVHCHPGLDGINTLLHGN